MKYTQFQKEVQALRKAKWKKEKPWIKKRNQILDFQPFPLDKVNERKLEAIDIILDDIWEDFEREKLAKVVQWKDIDEHAKQEWTVHWLLFDYMRKNQ